LIAHIEHRAVIFLFGYLRELAISYSKHFWTAADNTCKVVELAGFGAYSDLNRIWMDHVHLHLELFGLGRCFVCEKPIGN